MMDSLITVTKKKLQQAQESFVNLPTLSYAPWDSEAARKRLLTFTHTKWPKRHSEECDARQAAIKGWSCIDTNLLHCQTCDSILVQTSHSENLREALESVYARQLSIGHSRRCPWRDGKCSEDVFDRLLYSTQQEWIPSSNEEFSECSFGCTRAIHNTLTKYHRWFCPFIYKTNNKY